MLKVITLLSTLLIPTGPPAELKAPQDIDAFMAKVLEKRDIDWDRFYNYTCRDREVLEFEGTL